MVHEFGIYIYIYIYILPYYQQKIIFSVLCCTTSLYLYAVLVKAFSQKKVAYNYVKSRQQKTHFFSIPQICAHLSKIRRQDFLLANINNYEIPCTLGWQQKTHFFSIQQISADISKTHASDYSLFLYLFIIILVLYHNFGSR